MTDERSLTWAGGIEHMAKHFYDASGRSSSAESARLATMAAAADVVSLTALDGLIDRDGIVVVDVGAGESTSLGAALEARNPSATYLPVDIRPAAVNAHRTRGCDGRLGSATDLPLDDASVDAVHARFVFAWLDLAGRRRAVEEMLRVSRCGSRLVVIDYDWGSAAGPEVVEKWKQRLLMVLTAFGFDPHYGRRLAIDVRQHLTDAGLHPGDYTVEECSTTRTEPLREALATISQTVAPVVEQLAALDLTDDADELSTLHTEVVRYADAHPRAPISFPTMVTTMVELETAAAVSAATATIGQGRAARRRRAATTPLPPVGPPELGVYRLESADLIDQARRLHAAEYHQHGHVTDDSIDADGFLIADLDPPDVVARSTYLGVLDDEGLVSACLRMIRPTRGDMTTLPTLRKLLAQRSTLRVIEPPFPTGSVLFEVSGLAKSSVNRDRTAILRLLLATGCEASRCGDDFAVMGVVESTAKLLMTVFGTQAIRPFDPSSTITVEGVGVRPGGIRLVPCYAETATFVNDLLRHCQSRPGRELSRLNQPLIELTAAACGSVTRVA